MRRQYPVSCSEVSTVHHAFDGVSGEAEMVIGWVVMGFDEVLESSCISSVWLFRSESPVGCGH